MRTFAVVLLILALATGCSSRTRYTLNTDLVGFIPASTRSNSFPAGSATLIVPSEAGQLVPSPQLDIIESGRIVAKVSIQNTGLTPLSGSFEIRLGPGSDSNINDNSGGDFALGTTSFSVAAGSVDTVNLNLPLNQTENKAALDLIKKGSFRIALKLTLASSGGTYSIQQALVSVTGRPFAIIP
ncbi:hypothetical protein [Meiothermus granaticius]|uniref:Late embryogenesis abundant protein n=1 Tax=Meiothermus granaticius NBRC 107808 TaxID=1227551 RepID=A0A399FDR5_9DEIN|nr:hypothetical protein [Meiothermus granaticius]MCL6527211.1 hypothetical protein [Thermaceae bacterium]RIH93935.1 hypothetical protein Mgrana_00021 [Meiothermus granaticius NBRC 107808]GEM87819.1 hypothetical protein MGR01S_24440 [Meiothermus granaticius NBRC 107808]